MAKGVPTKKQREQIKAQRRTAQAALAKNRVATGRGKYRQLTARERSAYQRVIKRSDKILGPASKPPTTKLGAEARKALRTVKAFAERIRSGTEEFNEIPERMPK